MASTFFEILFVSLRRDVFPLGYMKEYLRAIFLRKSEATFLEQDTPAEYENSILDFSIRRQSCWGIRLPNPSVAKSGKFCMWLHFHSAASLPDGMAGMLRMKKHHR